MILVCDSALFNGMRARAHFEQKVMRPLFHLFSGAHRFGHNKVKEEKLIMLTVIAIDGQHGDSDRWKSLSKIIHKDH